MLEGVAIIGAGPAGITTALTLVELGYPGDKITILDLGEDFWARNKESDNGFFGNSRYGYNIFPTEVGVGGDLETYMTVKEATKYIQQAIGIFKTYNDTQDLPTPVKKSKYGKVTIGKEGFERTLAMIWVKLYKAGVNFLYNTEVNHLQGTLVNYSNAIEDSTVNAEKVVISSGTTNLTYLYHFIESNNLRATKELNLDVDKTELFLQDINYMEIPKPKVKVDSNFEIPEFKNIYTVGSLVGGFSITSAIAQGIKLGEIIYEQSKQ
jgi:predicted flavoprotein YhiN